MTALDSSTIDAIASAVAAKLRAPSLEPLWSISEVATFLGYTERVVREKKMREPNFPKPVRLPALRFYSSEIRAYAAARQG